jgi:hypothetical protein
MDSGWFLEVKNVIISIGTKTFWKYASVPELLADHQNWKSTSA